MMGDAAAGDAVSYTLFDRVTGCILGWGVGPRGDVLAQDRGPAGLVLDTPPGDPRGWRVDPVAGTFVPAGAVPAVAPPSWL